MRTLAIGDIHGCSTALDCILDAVKPRPQDTIVTLGDYVDRGPDSKGVIDRLLKLNEQCQLITLKGNHEIMMLEARQNRHKKQVWYSKGGKETLISYREGQKKISLNNIPPSHWNFVEVVCRSWWETEHHLFVHANLDPGLPLCEQSEHQLFWEKFSHPAPHYSGKIMVCGHTSQKDGCPVNLGHAICIDTWAYGKGWLTCLEIETGKIWQANQQKKLKTTNIDHFYDRPSIA